MGHIQTFSSPNPVENNVNAEQEGAHRVHIPQFIVKPSDQGTGNADGVGEYVIAMIRGQRTHHGRFLAHSPTIKIQADLGGDGEGNHRNGKA